MGKLHCIRLANPGSSEPRLVVGSILLSTLGRCPSKTSLIREQETTTLLLTRGLHRLERHAHQSVHPHGRPGPTSQVNAREAVHWLPETQLHAQRNKWVHKTWPPSQAPPGLSWGRYSETVESHTEGSGRYY